MTAATDKRHESGAVLESISSPVLAKAECIWRERDDGQTERAVKVSFLGGDKHLWFQVSGYEALGFAAMLKQAGIQAEREAAAVCGVLNDDGEVVFHYQ